MIPPAHQPVRVVVVDDQPLIRHSLRLVVDAADGLAVVGEAGSGAQALAVARQTRPDVVLMDIRMPGGDGIEATRRIVADPDLGATRVLVLSMFELDEHVHGALRAGASGFLLKDAEPDVLVDAVRRVASGEGLVDQTLTRRVIDEFARRRSPAAPDDVASGLLTAREHDILALLCRGSSNAEIAAALYLEASTVKSHLSRIMTKTGMRDRVQLVVWAYEHGIAAPTR